MSVARTRTKKPPSERTVPYPDAFPAEVLAGLLHAGVRPRFLRRLLCNHESPDAWRSAPLLDGEDPNWRHVEPVCGEWDTAVVWGGAGYPSEFGKLPTPPPVLFIRGTAAGLGRGIGVIGSRSMTELGSIVATIAVETAVELGAGVVSGLARGVDSFAHTTALAAGARCVAFHGAGLGVMSSEQEQLSAAIAAAGGAVCSEVPASMTPSPQTLMARNRLIAAFSTPLVVAEAGQRSGSTFCAGEAVALDHPIVVPRPRPGHRRQPGAAGLSSLAASGDDAGRRLGWSSSTLAKVQHHEQVANAVCDTRDDLVTAIKVFWWLST
jgi:DNA protecting protein DprA